MDIFRAEDLRKNLYSFFIIRFFFLAALFFAFFLFPFINEQTALFSFRNKILLVIIFFFILVNFVSLILNRTFRRQAWLRVFAYLQFFLELFFWILVAYLTGGISSPYLYVVVITIMYSGFILDEKGALFTTVSSFILLVLMAFFIKSSILPIISVELIDLYALEWPQFFSKLFVYLFFFSIAGLIATRVARAIQRVNRELFERELMAQELKTHFYAIFGSLSMGFVVTRDKRLVYANDFARNTCVRLDAFVERILGAPYTYMNWLEVRWEGKILYYSVQQYVDNQEVLIFSDVTELRLREEENRRREKMAAIGQLTASIAHEIKNPIASLIGASEIVFSTVQHPDEDSKRLMDIISREGERVKKLLDSLFTSTEERQLTIAMLALKALIEDTCKVFSMSYPAIRIDLSLDEVSLEGDADRLREVLWNLLINSIEAMKKQGVLSIRTEREETSVAIILRDRGGGIPVENLERIFDPFFSTKKRGTGLGLAVVYNVVKMHGGTTGVRNVEGGAEFRVTLPYKQEGGRGEDTNTGR